MKPTVFTVPYGEQIHYVPAGCLHWPVGEKDMLRRWVKEMQRLPNAFTILMGDTQDCARTHYRDHVRGYRADQNSQLALDEWVRRDVGDLARELMPIQGQIAGAILGNHLWEFCLEGSAEALTEEGWKTHDQLKLGETILAYDPVTGTVRWEPLEAIHVSTIDGAAVRTKVGVATLAHKWYGRTRPGNMEHSYKFSEDGLVGSLSVPVTGSPAWSQSESVPDWLVDLAGWVVTDGTLVRCATKPSMNKRVRIFQKSDSPKVDIIRGALEVAGHPFAYHVRSDGIGVFEFGGFVASSLRATMDANKCLSYSWLHLLSPRQVDRLFTAFVLGDGVTNDGVAQVDVRRLEPLMAAMTWSGIPCRMKKWASGIHVLYRKKRMWTDLAPEASTHTGVVWCPTVASGYWVARNRGRVFVTGNSDGTNSEQYLCQLLRIPYLGPTGIVCLDFRDKGGKGRCRLQQVIYAHHQGGSMGGRTTGADVNALERSELVFDADIYTLSHTHRRFGFKLPKLGVTSKGQRRLIERTKVFVRSGAFLKGFGEDNPGTSKPHIPSYAESKALRPTDLGWVTVGIFARGESGGDSGRVDYTVTY